MHRVLVWIPPAICAALVTSCTQIQSSISPSPQPPVTPSVASVAASPTAAAPKTSEALSLNNAGVKQINAGEYAGAIQKFTAAIALNPKLAPAYLGRGIAYSMINKHREAVKDHTQAIQLKSDLAEAYLNRADDYVELGNRKAAIADLQKAKQLFQTRGDRDNTEVANSRLVALQTTGSLQVASATTVPVANNRSSAPTREAGAATSASAPSSTASSANVSPEVALARHLRRVNAKMYAAYWCGVCQRQLRMFGEEAAKEVTVIECDPRGQNAQPELCDRVGIRAFPTWEINGKLLEPGGFSLQGLAEVSGYNGSRDFAYSQ